MKSPLLYTALLVAFASSAFSTTVYENTSTAPNVPSLGYQATSTYEFGNAVNLVNGGQLTSATLTMSSWALFSTYASDPRYSANSASYTHPLTLNIYNYNNDGTVGSLLGSETVNAVIPYRPAADPNCSGGGWSPNGGANCYSGFAFNVAFDFTSTMVIVPNQIVFGLAFDTQSYGLNPLGVDGPYNSLNFGLGDPPTIGSNVYGSSAYWNTTFAPFYGDAGAGGTGTFRLDFYASPTVDSWAGIQPLASFDTVPEPGTVLLSAGALGLLVLLRRKK